MLSEDMETILDLSDYLEGMSLGTEVRILSASITDGGGRSMLRVVADTASGITTDELSRIAKQLRVDEGVAHLVGGTNFGLEVTSPGMKRGLTEPWQYQRHLGQRLKLTIATASEKEAGEAHIDGRLVRLKSNGVLLDTPDGEKSIDWGHIRHAVVQLDW